MRAFLVVTVVEGMLLALDEWVPGARHSVMHRTAPHSGANEKPNEKTQLNVIFY